MPDHLIPDYPIPDQSTRPRRAGMSAVAALVAILGIGSLAVYGITGQVRNGGLCLDALKTARGLEDLRHGDMAAFRPAQTGLDLGQLTFSGPDGAPTSIRRLKGRVLLVNLWATWCVPCRTEMPALDALEGALGGEKFAVVAIDLDPGGDDRPKAFFEARGITHLARYADRPMKVFEAVKTEGLAPGLPSSLLIDRTGCLIGSLAGAAAWNDAPARALIAAAIAAQR